MQQIITIQMTAEEFKEKIKESVKEVITEVVQSQHIQNQKEEKSEQLISIPEAAVLLKVTKATIWNYRKQGKIKERKIGRRVLFVTDELLKATKQRINFS